MENKYAAVAAELRALLDGETQAVLKMATIVAVLKTHFAPRFYWTGFYLMHRGELIIGPYQGTVACQHIALSRGICGRAMREGQTQIVADTHADPQHIACDARSCSEIVVPIRRADGQLLGVLDVDSLDYNAFTTDDQAGLELILNEHLSSENLEWTYI